MQICARLPDGWVTIMSSMEISGKLWESLPAGRLRSTISRSTFLIHQLKLKKTKREQKPLRKQRSNNHAEQDHADRQPGKGPGVECHGGWNPRHQVLAGCEPFVQGGNRRAQGRDRVV